MSLPETIWWCKGHSDASRVPYHPAIEGDWRDDNCKWEEVELHPVGTRVAGRDDLVIRREDIDYEAAVAYLEAHLPEDVRPYADRMATETIDAALVAYAQLQSDCDC